MKNIGWPIKNLAQKVSNAPPRAAPNRSAWVPHAYNSTSKSEIKAYANMKILKSGIIFIPGSKSESVEFGRNLPRKGSERLEFWIQNSPKLGSFVDLGS